MSATEPVRFYLPQKDHVVLTELAAAAQISLSEFCRQLAEVRAATEREKACPRCTGKHTKSRSWTRSNLGQA